MNRTSILLLIILSACDWFDSDQSQADLVKDIPELTKNTHDSLFSNTTDGRLLYDSVVFSGYVIAYYTDGSIRSKKGYLEGRQEGDALIYYSDGALHSRRPYLNGAKHGEHMGYYPDGQVKFQYYFENGLSQGVHRAWFKNGEPRKEMNYKDGFEFGTQKVWRPDGKLRSNYVIRENGRRYGMLGLKRCSKIDSDSGNIDPYTGENER
ncbi:MAG: toxin-antitoxin system YwqK family antitoxin [Reichenbachiella sp.]|uniref:toxin-antitoxin system YwqK family antitoxin n=1 Tax=Reichenbachiella sp. TaxID=2184521 RepID=UPI0032664B0B